MLGLAVTWDVWTQESNTQRKAAQPNRRDPGNGPVQLLLFGKPLIPPTPETE